MKDLMVKNRIKYITSIIELLIKIQLEFLYY